MLSHNDDLRDDVMMRSYLADLLLDDAVQPLEEDLQCRLFYEELFHLVSHCKTPEQNTVSLLSKHTILGLLLKHNSHPLL